MMFIDEGAYAAINEQRYAVIKKYAFCIASDTEKEGGEECFIRVNKTKSLLNMVMSLNGSNRKEAYKIITWSKDAYEGETYPFANGAGEVDIQYY